MPALPIREFMTHPVKTVGAQQSLAMAYEVMNALRIRHLPVRDGGRLVGVVSQRDLHLVETLKDVDPREVPVEDAMSDDVLLADADMPLADVAHEMARRRCGSAVVTRGDEVVGIFTTTDALVALQALLFKPARPKRRRKTPARTRTSSKRTGTSRGPS